MINRLITALAFGLLLAAALITQGERELPLILMAALAAAWFLIVLPLILIKDSQSK